MSLAGCRRGDGCVHEILDSWAKVDPGPEECYRDIATWRGGLWFSSYRKAATPVRRLPFCVWADIFSGAGISWA